MQTFEVKRGRNFSLQSLRSQHSEVPDNITGDVSAALRLVSARLEERRQITKSSSCPRMCKNQKKREKVSVALMLRTSQVCLWKHRRRVSLGPSEKQPTPTVRYAPFLVTGCKCFSLAPKCWKWARVSFKHVFRFTPCEVFLIYAASRQLFSASSSLSGGVEKKKKNNLSCAATLWWSSSD